MKINEKYFIISLAIVIGLGLNGYFIGRAIQRFNQEDRTISVKGFSEREVKADLAVWTITTRITTDDLSWGIQEIELKKQKIIDFLMKNGIQNDEILLLDLSVTDKLAREYVDPNMGGFRFLIQLALQVRSKNVDNIQQVSRKTDELLKAGIVISNQEYQPSVQYIFTRLKDIKPEMLKEATLNAKKSALEFTRESKVRLGKLKKASQGLFSIIDRDDFFSGQGGEGSYYPSNIYDVYKKVRVVINMEYSVR